MQKHFFILFILFFAKTSAQELIYNGDFEQPNLCVEYLQECSPSGWYATYHAMSQFGYMKHVWKAQSGRHYVFFQVEGKDYLLQQRTYIQTKLICPLEKGKKYRLSGYLLRKDKRDFQRIGIFFPPQKIENQEGRIREKPHFFIEKKNIAKGKRKDKWKKIELEFIAKDNHEIMIIGNFETLNPDGLPKKREDIRYYMDNISLVPVTKTEKCATYEQNISALIADRKRHSIPPKVEPIKKKESFLSEKPATTIVPKQDTVIALPKIKTKMADTIVISAVCFDFDSDKILPKYQKQIYEQLEVLKNRKFTRLEIIGHTDNIGDKTYNLRLSERRANNISRFINEKFAIPNEKMLISGKGDTFPIADNMTESGRNQNRRVEILLFD